MESLSLKRRSSKEVLVAGMREYDISLPKSNTTFLPRLLVQVQLVRDDDTPWGDWIPEIAIVRQPSPNLVRLSGGGIRDALYVGTPPGNHLLAVSATKGGLASLL